ncbi:SIR2-like domain-containing protein [Cohaesibacter sp. ES.047]|uniref:SIR2 family protein n=1 Tax=Cohaesibacter sp. ES.047 TaxID=1798205 RepID=UPI000BB7429E|nr:SIR2 family protein [Cohaesibacter sp. ES.047]SNY92916.1 SIR2-like domain-containing protein [Cohaesibacter sp. ES.047]
MAHPDLQDIIGKIACGDVVPYLGPGVLFDVKHAVSGDAMPADSDSLIITMNRGRPMAPKLMYEFPRAAMNQELKRGRRFIEQFLTKLYGEQEWTRAALHDWLKDIKPAYVIDINRDTQLQDSFADKPHLLIQGVARVGGTDFRYILNEYDGESYRAVTVETAAFGLPKLFKPLGSPAPQPTYIASDADFVDYITELMGGFGVPSFIKDYRKGKQYLFLGMRFTRDTERMVMSDIIHDAAEPAGWALIAEPTEKERRYCKKKKIEIIEMDVPAFLEETRGTVAA